MKASRAWVMEAQEFAKAVIDVELMRELELPQTVSTLAGRLFLLVEENERLLDELKEARLGRS